MYINQDYIDLLYDTCEELGTPRSSMSETCNRASLSDFLSLIEEGLELTRRPDLGVIYGQKLNLMRHGLFGAAAHSAPDFVTAMDIVVEHSKHAGAPFTNFYFIDGDKRQLGFRISSAEHLAWFMEDTILGSFIGANTIALAMNGAPSVEAVYLARSEPEYIQSIQELVNFKVAFTQADNRVVFNETSLLLKNPFANDTVHSEYTRRLALLNNKRNVVSLVHNVEQQIAEHIHDLPDIDSLAQQMNMSTRTLIRKLKDADTSYRQMIQDFRSQRAAELLISSSLSIDEIAHKLGYSNSNSFGKAFRKWHDDCSPSEFRRQHSQT